MLRLASQLGNLRQIAFGDIDGDDELDIVVGDRGIGGVVFLNNGDRTFARQPDVAFARGGVPALGYFDDDDQLHLALARDGSAESPRRELAYYRGRGDGTFELIRVEELEAVGDTGQMFTADMNGDGATDLVVGGTHITIAAARS
jgi:hypothetical protein